MRNTMKMSCYYYFAVATRIAIIMLLCGWGVESESQKVRCGATDISVNQAMSSWTGIPRYRVEITNLCSDPECKVADLHLHCGWFASANLVKPTSFKRIAYDDCLVNAGSPIPFGKTIAFQYSNTRPYPLSVASFVCAPPN